MAKGPPYVKGCLGDAVGVAQQIAVTGEEVKREARMLASLSHPNLATIHEVGHAAPRGEDGTVVTETPVHFLVVELVEGEDLSERIARDPLSNVNRCDNFPEVTPPPVPGPPSP